LEKLTDVEKLKKVHRVYTVKAWDVELCYDIAFAGDLLNYGLQVCFVSFSISICFFFEFLVAKYTIIASNFELNLTL
jgi:hypothetical protein